jgi:multidrug efflux system outer membrane protein
VRILATLLAFAFGLGPGSAEARAQTSAPESPWWEELADPTLVELLVEAVDANGDLQAAVQSMLQADAAAARARAALLPSVSVDAQTSTGPLDGLGFQFGGIPREGADVDLPPRFYTGSASLRASYRLTSWGTEYRSSRASRLEAMAARGDEDGVALALVGQVAGAYYDAVSAARRVEVISRQVEVGQQLAELSRLRYERGEATALEVLQQRQQLATTLATLPPARAERRLAESRLATLLGRDPTAAQAVTASALPTPPGAPSSEATPSPEGRPDLRGAEYRLEAAGARASAAKWGLLPTIDLSGRVGSEFFRSLGTTTQSTWGMSVSASLPLFDGLDRTSRIRETSAARRGARSAYDQLRRSAEAEVVAADIQQQEQRAQLDALRAQLDASERAFEESRRRYLAGLATVLDVLNAMNGMQQAELGVIRTERSVLASWIQGRQALGGAWTVGIRQRLRETP